MGPSVWSPTMMMAECHLLLICLSIVGIICDTLMRAMYWKYEGEHCYVIKEWQCEFLTIARTFVLVLLLLFGTNFQITWHGHILPSCSIWWILILLVINMRCFYITLLSLFIIIKLKFYDGKMRPRKRNLNNEHVVFIFIVDTWVN